jgi:hypothetical protein
MDLPPTIDPGTRDLILGSHLDVAAANATHVTASTFVPPASARFRGKPELATEDFDAGGLHITKEAQNVIAGEFTLFSGDLFEDAEVYRTKNPVSLDEGRRTVAGEQLGEYTLMTFVTGVDRIVGFAETAVTSIQDVPLVELLRSSD